MSTQTSTAVQEKTQTLKSRPPESGKKHRDIYEEITNMVIERLEKGVIPWRCPWNSPDTIQKNFLTNRKYRAINQFLLSLISFEKGYKLPFWLTFNQAKGLEGSIKKGSKAAPVYYADTFFVEATPEEAEAFKKGENPDKYHKFRFNEKKGYVEKEIWFLRVYSVFNIEQTEEIDYSKYTSEPKTRENDPILECQKIVEGYRNKPQIIHKEFLACYNQRNDVVQMPEMEFFKSSEEYYSTLFHELAHSTGHASRLNRKSLTGVSSHGDTEYAKEELIAEMGSSFLCSEAGIATHTIDNSAAYIDNWLSVLKQKKNVRLVYFAAHEAEKAANLILDVNEGDQP